MSGIRDHHNADLGRPPDLSPNADPSPCHTWPSAFRSLLPAPQDATVRVVKLPVSVHGEKGQFTLQVLTCESVMAIPA